MIQQFDVQLNLNRSIHAMTRNFYRFFQTVQNFITILHLENKKNDIISK